MSWHGIQGEAATFRVCSLLGQADTRRKFRILHAILGQTNVCCLARYFEGFGARASVQQRVVVGNRTRFTRTVLETPKTEIPSRLLIAGKQDNQNRNHWPRALLSYSSTPPPPI